MPNVTSDLSGTTTIENIEIPSIDITLICHTDSTVILTRKANSAANVIHIPSELCSPSDTTTLLALFLSHEDVLLDCVSFSKALLKDGLCVLIN